MGKGHHKTERVLAVDPTSRGFGFVLLESPDKLIDWGVKEVRRDKQRLTLRKVGELIERYHPGVFVVEDFSHSASRRRARARSLIEALGKVARDLNLGVHRVSPATIRATLSEETATKHDIAVLLAQRFPELARCLPPQRKPWMSEHHAQAVFDAMALAIAFLSRKPHHVATSTSRLSPFRATAT